MDIYNLAAIIVIISCFSLECVNSQERAKISFEQLSVDKFVGEGLQINATVELSGSAMLANPLSFWHNTTQISNIAIVNDPFKGRYNITLTVVHDKLFMFTVNIKDVTESDSGTYKWEQTVKTAEKEEKIFATMKVKIHPRPEDTGEIQFMMELIPGSEVSASVRNALKMNNTKTVIREANKEAPKTAKAVTVKAGDYKLSCKASGGIPPPQYVIMKGEEILSRTGEVPKVKLTDGDTDLACKTKQEPLYGKSYFHELSFSMTVIAEKPEVSCEKARGVLNDVKRTISCTVNVSYTGCENIVFEVSQVGSDVEQFKHGEKNNKYEFTCKEGTEKNTYRTDFSIMGITEEDFDKETTVYNIIVINPHGSSHQVVVPPLKQVVHDGAGSLVSMGAVTLTIAAVVLSYVL